MDNIKKVPDIRFEGFDDEWCELLLDELAEFNPKANLPNEFKYVDLESVVGTKILSFRKIKKESAPSRAQRVAKKGDVFYQTVRPYQKNNCIFEMNNEDFVFSTGYAQLRPNVEGNYLLNVMQKETFVKKVLDNCTGTSYPAISSKNLSSINVISSPISKEQAQIGSFFKNLDEKLELEKEKHEKLINFKKAMLGDMFPKEGEKVPKVRFEGFDGEWCPYKIEELFFVTRGYVLSTDKISKVKNSENKYPVYSSQTMNSGLLGYYAKYLYEDAITWTTDGANAGTVKYRGGKFYSTNVNGVLLKNNITPNIAIAEMLNILTPKHVTRVGNPKLMNNIMSKIVVKIPLESSELEMISDFFKNLDEKIELSEKKIKKIENFKKAMLEKMFV